MISSIVSSDSLSILISDLSYLQLRGLPVRDSCEVETAQDGQLPNPGSPRFQGTAAFPPQTATGGDRRY
jgi:hypothetical protein